MKCMICGSDNIKVVDTEISDFVMDRISDSFNGKNNIKTKLCFCNDCTFAFYEYRMNDEEQSRLYKNYRDSEYQKTREKYECWYTNKVNAAMNNDIVALNEQRRVIVKFLNKNNIRRLNISLDYGGNEGKTFTKRMGENKRFVYDISGVNTVKGVKNLKSIEEVKQNDYDFIMCNMLFEHLSYPEKILNEIYEIGNKETIYYIEVPSENPFIKNKFSIKNNLSLLFNRYYNNFKLAKYYFVRRKKPFMPMSEHINFFTIKSIKTLVEKSGFEVIDVEENVEKAVLGRPTVLSILFRKRNDR